MRRIYLLGPLVIVIAFDLVLWEFKSRGANLIALSAIPGVAIILGLILMILMGYSDRPVDQVAQLPENMRFKGSAGSSEMLQTMLQQIDARMQRMERSVLTTESDVRDARDYIAALEMNLKEQDRITQVQSRNFAIFTTMIGIIAGWIPLLLSSLPSIPWQR